MNLNGNTILVTGGASGIGFALAKRFADAGSEVIICGRREEQLKEAKKLCPALYALRCDVSLESERRELVERMAKDFPALNVLVNNAGIQNRVPPLRENQDWSKYRQEIAINLEAPMHLSMLFLSQLLSRPKAAVINVSSGLAFSPLAFMPSYCATKAAIHSFTLSLRYQLRETSVEVIEVIPPAVKTDLGGKGLHDYGVPLDEFADHVMARIAKGELEFGFQFSEKARLASRQELGEIFANMNK
jgi:uncharacterized oxidoreductase